jgi:hypothetical protein
VFVSTTPGGPRRGGLQWTAAAVKWADTVGPLARAAVKAKAPVGKGPTAGRLRDSTVLRRVTAPASVRAEIGATAPHAPYVVDGTRPHVIVPRTARVLHFQTAAGVDVFTRRVNHPGTKPNPYARRAIEAILPEVRKAFTEIMREAMGGGP